MQNTQKELSQHEEEEPYHNFKIAVMKEDEEDLENAKFVMRVPLDLVDGWETCSEWDAAFEFSEFERDWFWHMKKPPNGYKFVAIKVDEYGKKVET